MDHRFSVLLATIALAALFPLAASATELTGKPRIIDGDTIVIGDQRIRLHGIDTPEAKQTYVLFAIRCGRRCLHRVGPSGIRTTICRTWSCSLPSGSSRRGRVLVVSAGLQA